MGSQFKKNSILGYFLRTCFTEDNFSTKKDDFPNHKDDCSRILLKNDGVFLDLRPSVLLPIRPTSTWFYSC